MARFIKHVMQAAKSIMQMDSNNLKYSSATCPFSRLKLLNNIDSEIDYLTRIILTVIKEKKPQSVKQLTQLLKERINLEEEKIIEYVLKLKAEGVIKLSDRPIQILSLATYLKTGESVWYWTTIAIGMLATTLVFVVPESAYPWIYARNFLGVIFVLLLPGYAFIKALFPNNVSSKPYVSGLNSIERFALSIGLSITLITIVGLILYFSPLVFDLTTIVLSIFGLTLILATAAIIREYRAKITK